MVGRRRRGCYLCSLYCQFCYLLSLLLLLVLFVVMFLTEVIVEEVARHKRQKVGVVVELEEGE